MSDTGNMLTEPLEHRSVMVVKSEKLKELEEMKRKFPEINWGGDEILNHGADDVMKNMDSMSTVSPALRPGWGR